jgi:hypothetical protein
VLPYTPDFEGDISANMAVFTDLQLGTESHFDVAADACSSAESHAPEQSERYAAQETANCSEDVEYIKLNEKETPPLEQKRPHSNSPRITASARKQLNRLKASIKLADVYPFFVISHRAFVTTLP